MESPTVKRIGKYEVLDVLGKGGMGVVYKAVDPAIGRLVAIKMITTSFAEDPDYLRRFYREAQSTGKLQHHNIVIVHDLGDQDGAPFLVMEYLEGESLQNLIKTRRPMPLLDKLDLIIQGCNGLHYAHQRNIVHRDIKPANLMVLNDGLLKIVDFGIARVESENVTLPGQVVGTIQYMSPEQLNGIPVDCRTDIFSTAVVLYQLLTYSLPFQGKDTGSTLLKIINEPAPRLQKFLETYPAELDDILQRALAKARQDRYATAEDFAFELGQVHDQLKRELVSEYLKTAEDLMSRAELGKAKEQIFQILKVDRQNRRASDLLKEVQRRMDAQQRSEQARQLRAQAEEAILNRQLERALKHLDQAVQLDPQNAELIEARKNAYEEKARVEKVQESLRRAESAQWAGNLDEALATVKEALELDPHDTEAKALHSSIIREIAERSRQMEIEGLVADAQRQISSRRFTAAIEVLQKAEALDPNAPAVKDLMALAASGREQERRRKEVEQLSAEIQEALNHDDYRLACEKADSAVQRFPNEHGLLKLQAMAERQRQVGERRQFVEEQISRARKLLDSRHTEEALETLEAARNRYPTEPALLSLLTVVRENLERERFETRKQEYIQRAKEALRRKEYEEATSILETARAELDAPEIEDLLQFVKDEAVAQTKRQTVDAAAHEAHRLIDAAEYEDAIAFLQGVLQDLSDEELEILLADAQRQLNDFNRRVNDAIATAERLLGAERFIEAVRYLESQADVCGRSAEFRAMLERARGEQDRMRTVATALQSARSALSTEDYVAAAAAVEECRQRIGEHPDLANMAREIDAHRREAATKTVSKAIADSRMLLLGRSYQSAVELLDSVAGLIELTPGEVRLRYSVLHQEAVRGAERRRQEPESYAAHAGTGVVENETDEQREWKAPASFVAAAKEHRERDLQELTQLGTESDRATDYSTLRTLSDRARLIAKRHPGDSEIETLAAHVATIASTRAHQVAAAAEIITPTSVPAATVVPSAEELAEQLGSAPVLPSATEAPQPPQAVAFSGEIAPTAYQAASPTPPPAVEIPAGETVVQFEPVQEEAAPAAMVVEPTVHPIATSMPETVATVLAPQREATARVLEPKPEVAPSGPPERPGPVLVPSRTTGGARGRLAMAAIVVLAIVGVLIWRPWKTAIPAGQAVLVVSSQPLGASVHAGNASCVTPNCNLALEPGTYNVEVSRPGYAPQSPTVRIEKGKIPPALNLTLQPLPSVVRINTNLAQGSATLDGRAAGALINGQLALNNVAAGKHSVKVTGPDGDAELDFTVAPAQAPVVGSSVRARNISVLVVSSLGGATHLDCNCAGTQNLVVDGRPFGELTAAGRMLGDLGEGVHELRLGSGDETHTASVKLGAAPVLEVFLNAERNAGTLVVETENADNADVFVNGKKYPNTAGNTLRIPLDAKEYSVRVQKSGYETAAPQQVQIRKNQETRVVFKLTQRVEKAYVAMRGGLPGAQISIDGSPAGTVDADGRFQSPAISAGDHSLVIEKDGYQSRTVPLQLKDGETRRLTAQEVQMAKAALPPPPTTSAAAAKSPPAQPVTPPVDAAESDWERVRDSSDRNALKDYIAKYPNSSHLSEANKKLQQFDWDAVKSSTDPKDLQAFLDTHPNGIYSDQARGRLQQVKAEADRKAILAIVEKYKVAYERGDVGLLTQIWPTIDKRKAKDLQGFFDSARDVRVQLTTTDGPEIQGDKAKLQSTLTVDYTLRGQAAKPIEANTLFQFRKKDGAWFLDSVK